jgi:hypothetical protein
MKSLNFPTALTLAMAGAAIQREGWNGRGQLVRVQMPDAQSKMTQPYSYIQQADGTAAGGSRLVPWVPSQGDLFATDWRVVA